MRGLNFFELVGIILKISGAVIVSVIMLLIAIFLIALVVMAIVSIIAVAKKRSEKSARGEKQNKFSDDLLEYLESQDE